MKKVLFVFLGLVVLLAAAVVVLPGFINWNDYRGAVAARAEALTGRRILIGGDIHITVLPAPALVAHDVVMSNIDGASTPDMVRLKTLEVRIALGPLLGGAVQVENVKLVDPVIDLERLADGRVNWEFKPKASGSSSAEAPLPGVGGGGEASGSEAAVRLDSFIIENGTVVLRDAKAGTTERIEHLNARLAADSLSGPFDSVGDLVFRGVPLHYEANVERIVQGRTLPLNLILTAKSGATQAQISGALVELADKPKFKGRVVASGQSLAGIMAGIAGSAPSTPLLDRKFAVEGDVVASAASVEVKNLKASVGEIAADGNMTVTLSTPLDVNARLALRPLDLDALLATAEAPAKGEPKAETPSGTARDGGGTKAGKASPADLAAAAFAIPANLNGTFEVSADAITFQGNIISEARLNAELSGGELAISQLSAQLPGGSDLFATGFLSAKDGKPHFDGNVEANVSDMRRVMAWLGMEAPDVPSDRLRKASLKGRIVGGPQQIQGVNLDVVVDSSRLTGGITLALRKRLAFGANFRIDRLNLDAYMAPTDDAGTVRSAGSAASGGGGSAAGGKAGGGSVSGAAALAGLLNRFDANLKLQVGRLTWHRIQVDGVGFDGTLFGGNLEVRKASVADFAGASGTLKGSVTGLDGIPALKGLAFEFTKVDVDRMLRRLAIPVPFAARDLGVLKVTGHADGSVLGPNVAVVADGPVASVDLEGKLSLLPTAPLFAGDVKARHTDFVRLLRMLGVAYRPAGKLGAIGVSAAVKGDASHFALSGLNVKLGPTTVDGGLDVDLTGVRPRLTGDLKFGRLPIDAFLPANRTAMLVPPPGAPRIVPAAYRPGGDGADNALLWLAQAGGGRWSTDPIDLGALSLVDADLKLSAAEVSYDKIAVVGAAADATITEGTLRVSNLAGKLFGGALSGNAVVRSAPKPRIEGSLALANADFGEFELATRGDRLARGTINARTTFDAQGASQNEIVRNLNGDGSFELIKVALTDNGGKGSLGPVSGLLNGLNEVVGVLGGGNRPQGLADVSGSFTVRNGVARSDDLKFVSNLGDGQAKGTVDLPAWKIDVGGDVRLSQNLFAQLLSGATGVDVVLPFRITGDVNEPTVKVDTAKLPGRALKIPGKLLDKSGVGDVLRRIVPNIVP